MGSLVEHPIAILVIVSIIIHFSLIMYQNWKGKKQVERNMRDLGAELRRSEDRVKVLIEQINKNKEAFTRDITYFRKTYESEVKKEIDEQRKKHES